MSYQTSETNFHCVGSSYHPSTISIESEITKTSQKISNGKCVQYNGKNSIIFIDNTMLKD